MGITRTAIATVLMSNGHKVVGSSGTAEKGWLEILDIHPDLVVLDINLKGAKNGIWLAEKIREHLNIPIIFLTAYGNTSMIEKLTAVQPDGYITKPFNNATLLGTVQFAVNNYRSKSSVEISTPTTDRFKVIKTKNGIEKINLNDIVYLQSEGNYIHIFFDQQVVACRAKLDDLLFELDYSQLKRTHRRFAVNTAKITRIDKATLFMNTIEIPISKTYENSIINSFT
jgi:DNA-binding LytR/AlgR family response regulator